MRELCTDWCARGWAAQWKGRFGRCGEAATAGGDFFGLPADGSPVFVGVGGMQKLPRAILGESAGVFVHAGVRVVSVGRCCEHGSGDGLGGRWLLEGVGGVAAFHDTPEAQAAAAQPRPLGEFEFVLLTDVSSSFESWHRASAGVPEAIASRVRNRVRVPLFSCMVALPTALTVPLDGITFGDGSDDGAADGAGDCPVWFAARTSSKPGLEAAGAQHGADCWTLVSTPTFAAAEISRVTMQDETTGAFKPQEDSYLNAEPGPALYRAFLQAVSPLLPPGAPPPPPSPLYLQGQRWGSAFPAPAAIDGRDELGHGPTSRRIVGVEYETGVPPLMYERPPAAADASSDGDRDFIADDAAGLYYAGDYCSRRAPGFEAACLSGVAAAEHIAALVGKDAVGRT